MFVWFSAPPPPSVPPGLDPGVHPLRDKLLRRRWIAGSSPAMTARVRPLAESRYSPVPDDASPSPIFVPRNRNFLLGCLSVALFLAIWQAVFLVVAFNPLFIS